VLVTESARPFRDYGQVSESASCRTYQTISSGRSSYDADRRESVGFARRAEPALSVLAVSWAPCTKDRLHFLKGPGHERAHLRRRNRRLTLAICLERRGHSVTIVERAPRPRGDGYMIDSLAPATTRWNVLVFYQNCRRFTSRSSA
jgi:hypothetical protein